MTSGPRVPAGIGQDPHLIGSAGHKELPDDDCGLPEDPVFADYSKYLWKGHSENPRMLRQSRTTGKYAKHEPRM